MSLNYIRCCPMLCYLRVVNGFWTFDLLDEVHRGRLAERGTNCLAESSGRMNETGAEENATCGKGIDLLGQREDSELIVGARTGYNRRLLEESIRAASERRSYIWTVRVDEMNLWIVITGCRTDFLRESHTGGGVKMNVSTRSTYW